MQKNSHSQPIDKKWTEEELRSIGKEMIHSGAAIVWKKIQKSPMEKIEAEDGRTFTVLEFLCMSLSALSPKPNISLARKLIEDVFCIAMGISSPEVSWIKMAIEQKRVWLCSQSWLEKLSIKLIENQPEENKIKLINSCKAFFMEPDECSAFRKIELFFESKKVKNKKKKLTATQGILFGSSIFG